MVHPMNKRDSTQADVDNFYSPAVEVLGDIAASLTGLAERVSPLVLAPDVNADQLLVAEMKTLACRLRPEILHQQRMAY